MNTYRRLSALDSSVNVKLDDPENIIKSLKRLKKLNKQLARKTEGSNNEAKFKKKVSKLQKKIDNQREDFSHKRSIHNIGYSHHTSKQEATTS